MIKKIIMGAVAGILTCSVAYSQVETQQEVSVYVAGGSSTLQYNVKNADRKGSFGGSFGIGYNYYFTNEWSFSTGLELSIYNSKIKNTSPIQDSYMSNDGEYDFEFRTKVTGYKEKQEAMYLNIPVMTQFELPVIRYHKFYAAGGFKFGLPLVSKYKVKSAIIENSGYYSNWSGTEDELILHTQEFMGFGTFQRNNVKKDLDFKFACMLSLEAGMKWYVSNSMNLYTGAYFDYGLNDVKKKTNKPLIEYNTADPTNFINNSIFSSEIESKPLVEKVVPVALGIKIRLSFSI